MSLIMGYLIWVGYTLKEVEEFFEKIHPGHKIKRFREFLKALEKCRRNLVKELEKRG